MCEKFSTELSKLHSNVSRGIIWGIFSKKKYTFSAYSFLRTLGEKILDLEWETFDRVVETSFRLLSRGTLCFDFFQTSSFCLADHWLISGEKSLHIERMIFLP